MRNMRLAGWVWRSAAVAIFIVGLSCCGRVAKAGSSKPMPQLEPPSFDAGANAGLRNWFRNQFGGASSRNGSVSNLPRGQVRSLYSQ